MYSEKSELGEPSFPVVSLAVDLHGETIAAVSDAAADEYS